MAEIEVSARDQWIGAQNELFHFKHGSNTGGKTMRAVLGFTHSRVALALAFLLLGILNLVASPATLWATDDNPCSQEICGNGQPAQYILGCDGYYDCYCSDCPCGEGTS